MTGAGWMILTWGFLVGCRDCSRRGKCAAWALAPLTQRAGGGTAMPLQAARTQALCLGDPGDTCTAPGTPGARTTHPHSAVAAGSRGRFLLLHDRMTKGSRRTGQGGGGTGPLVPSTRAGPRCPFGWTFTAGDGLATNGRQPGVACPLGEMAIKAALFKSKCPSGSAAASTVAEARTSRAQQTGHKRKRDRRTGVTGCPGHSSL